MGQAAIVAILLAGTASGRALAGAPHFVTFGAEADAPVGFVEMCEREASQCSPSSPNPSQPDPTLVTAAITSTPPGEDSEPSPEQVPAIGSAALALENMGRFPACSTWSSCASAYPEPRFPASSPDLGQYIGIAYLNKDEACASSGSGRYRWNVWCNAFRTFETRQSVGDRPSAQNAPGPELVVNQRQKEDASAQSTEWRLVSKINHAVNSEVKEVTDLVRFGVDERWERPSGPHPEGDCEDIALEKRQRLIDAGFPAARLFLAVVFSQREGLHTLLVVRLTDGDYVLDNLSPFVVRWSSTPYTWLRLQVPGEPLVWRRLATS
jgi:predicted transglutaminase-like cysteine proteinase